MTERLVLHRPVPAASSTRPSSASTSAMAVRLVTLDRTAVLSDVRRTAVRHRDARRRIESSTSSTTTTAKSCTCSIGESLRLGEAPSGPARPSTAASTGPGASITCSSTPASTCCRRRSIGCIAARTVSFHLGAASSTIDLAASCRARRSRSQRPKPTASSGRIVPVTVRFVSAEEAAALPLRKEPARAGHAAADRHRWLRPVRVRRHACRDGPGAIGVDRASAPGAVQGRPARGVRLRRTRAGEVPVDARHTGGAVRLLSVLPEELPGAIERLQAETRERQRALTAMQKTLAGYQAEELAAAAEATAVGRLGASQRGRRCERTERRSRRPSSPDRAMSWCSSGPRVPCSSSRPGRRMARCRRPRWLAR